MEYCQKILSIVTITFCPLQLKELVATTELPEIFFYDIQLLNKLVDLCSSFLTVQDEIVYFIHQSAKDYFSTSQNSKIIPLGQAKEHSKIACQLLQVMSNTLRRDIYSLWKPSTLLNEVVDINQDILTHIQYIYYYQISHLHNTMHLLHN